MRFSEAQEFAQLAERAHPRWLALAVLLQAATYLAEGEIWRAVVRAGHSAISVPRAYWLSVATLFVDQTVPTGGVSGTILYVGGLQRLGVPRGVALAIVYAATMDDLIGATTSVGVVFLIVSTVFAVVVLLHSGAEPDLIASRLARAILCQLAIVCLDAGTIWAGLRAVGTATSTEAVFMLRSPGVSVSAALSATLIFRGLSFWLPMIPGMLCARRLTLYGQRR